MELINASTGDKHKVLKYAAPTKAAVGKININGEEVETRFTSARGKEYTYFPVDGVSLYVAGSLPADASFTLEVPENMKGPAWDGTRKSYYVRKRPTKPAAEGGEPAGETNEGGETSATADGGEAHAESTEGTGEVTEVSRPRRRRA